MASDKKDCAYKIGGVFAIDLKSENWVCIEDLVIIIRRYKELDLTTVLNALDTEKYDCVTIKITHYIEKESDILVLVQKILERIPSHVLFLRLMFSGIEKDFVLDFPKHIKSLELSFPASLDLSCYSIFDKLPLSLEILYTCILEKICNPPPLLRIIVARLSDFDPAIENFFLEIPTLEKIYFSFKIDILYCKSSPKIAGLELVDNMFVDILTYSFYCSFYKRAT